MAMPVLVTVTALGVGWVALSRARANMVPAQSATDATPATTPEVREHGDTAPGVAGIHGTTLTAHPEGGATIDPNQGQDPSTTPSSGSAPIGDAYKRPSAPVDATPAAHDAPMILAYGYLPSSGVTRYQEARSLAENGPALGQVW